jgi:hypothetical protein
MLTGSLHFPGFHMVLVGRSPCQETQQRGAHRTLPCCGVAVEIFYTRVGWLNEPANLSIGRIFNGFIRRPAGRRSARRNFGRVTHQEDVGNFYITPHAQPYQVDEFQPNQRAEPAGT